MKSKMTKAGFLHQIKNLTPEQCKQLEVEVPFEGEPTITSIMAWLGDGVLYDENGNAIEVDSLFADGDPATVTLHSGMNIPEEEVVEEEVVAEEVVTPSGNGNGTASIRSMVRSEVNRQKTRRPFGGVSVPLSKKHSKHFSNAEDQFVAGQWLGAKIFRMPSAQKWWNDNGTNYGRKQQLEGGATTGGNLVPSPLEQAILDVREEYGVARKVCRVFPMTSDTLAIPSLTTGATVQYPSEGSAITSADAAWGQVNCTAVKRACLMKWSAELGADSLFSLADVLSDYIGRALGIREDTEFIQGDGTGTFGSVTGLKNKAHSFVTGAGDNWGALTLANLADTTGTIADKYAAGSSWIMSRQFFSQVVLRVIAAAGGNTIDSLGVGASGSQLLGYPVVFSDQCPTATATDIDCCYFGNWTDAAVFADRSGIEIATSEHVDFASDLINIRGISRYDIQVHDGSAFAALATTA
jgi:HK97 family phage major capsid protein